MFQSAGIVCTAVILGIIVLVECNGGRHRQDIKEEEFNQFKSIECYECNSEYDPRCRDPFDPYSIGVVNCSMKRPLNHIKAKPTLCRKTVQKVQGNIRVIRGCGYIPHDRDDKECMVRSGTHDVNVRYCSCKHSLCNSAKFQSAPSRITLGATIFLIWKSVQRV